VILPIFSGESKKRRERRMGQGRRDMRGKRRHRKSDKKREERPGGVERAYLRGQVGLLDDLIEPLKLLVLLRSFLEIGVLDRHRNRGPHSFEPRAASGGGGEGGGGGGGRGRWSGRGGGGGRAGVGDGWGEGRAAGRELARAGGGRGFMGLFFLRGELGSGLLPR
jgi:hypothetical protein